MRIHTLRVPTPFPIGPVNLFLIVEDPITLVDTGPKTEEAFRSLRDQVEALGLRLEEIRRIIISHTHEDHAGLAAQIKQISNAAVYVHPWEAHCITGSRDYQAGRKMLRRVGVPAKVLDEMEARWKYIRTLIDPVPDAQILDEGDEVAFASESLRVLHTPGHTPGHICLWRDGERSLIAADTVLKRVTPNPVINLDPRDPNRRFPSLSMYLKSLARLRDLSPTLIYTGHGGEVNDLEGYYNEMLRHVRNRQVRLLDLFPPNAVTVWEMSLKLFPDVSDDARFLAISETSAHFDSATDEGKLIREDSDGIEYCRLA
ncbi:MAG: MBL fold metallo-hydrolase [Acidobacteria bacterium]|nr:MBL fold metallo-hydrolase [Acidobacteriota bacterium]